MPSGSTPIKLSLFYYDYYHLIINGKLHQFQEVGGFENKPYGNELLAYTIFRFLEDQKKTNGVPSDMLHEIQQFLTNFKYPEIKKQDYYDGEDSFHLALDGMFKDIVGTWGPTNYSFLKGTHIKLRIDGNQLNIVSIAIEDQKLKTNIVLSSFKAFLFASNVLFQGHYFEFIDFLIHENFNPDPLNVDEIEELDLPGNSKFGMFDNKRTIFRYLTQYYLYVSNELKDNEDFIYEVLHLNGIYTITSFIGERILVSSINDFLFDYKSANTSEISMAIFMCILSLIDSNPQLTQLLLDRLGIDKDKYDFLKNKIKNYIAKNQLFS